MSIIGSYDAGTDGWGTDVVNGDTTQQEAKRMYKNVPLHELLSSFQSHSPATDSRKADCDADTIDDHDNVTTGNDVIPADANSIAALLDANEVVSELMMRFQQVQCGFELEIKALQDLCQALLRLPIPNLHPLLQQLNLELLPLLLQLYDSAKQQYDEPLFIEQLILEIAQCGAPVREILMSIRQCLHSTLVSLDVVSVACRAMMHCTSAAALSRMTEKVKVSTMRMISQDMLPQIAICLGQYLTAAAAAAPDDDDAERDAQHDLWSDVWTQGVGLVSTLAKTVDVTKVTSHSRQIAFGVFTNHLQWLGIGVIATRLAAADQLHILTLSCQATARQVQLVDGQDTISKLYSFACYVFHSQLADFPAVSLVDIPDTIQCIVRLWDMFCAVGLAAFVVQLRDEPTFDDLAIDTTLQHDFTVGLALFILSEYQAGTPTWSIALPLLMSNLCVAGQSPTDSNMLERLLIDMLHLLAVCLRMPSLASRTQSVFDAIQIIDQRSGLSLPTLLSSPSLSAALIHDESATVASGRLVRYMIAKHSGWTPTSTGDVLSVLSKAIQSRSSVMTLMLDRKQESKADNGVNAIALQAQGFTALVHALEFVWLQHHRATDNESMTTCNVVKCIFQNAVAPVLAASDTAYNSPGHMLHKHHILRQITASCESLGMFVGQ
jgi:hypothetical protein